MGHRTPRTNLEGSGAGDGSSAGEIELHDSLHGCPAGRGTGTGIIQAKLAQQLAHLEQAPFFGIFIDLKKAFDAMDRGRCLAILALHGVGPQML